MDLLTFNNGLLVSFYCLIYNHYQKISTMQKYITNLCRTTFTTKRIRLTAAFYNKTVLESNLSKILPVDCKFIRGYTSLPQLNLTKLKLEY